MVPEEDHAFLNFSLSDEGTKFFAFYYIMCRVKIQCETLLWKRDSLQTQKGLLKLGSACISTEYSRSPYDSVAGDENRDRIFFIGLTNCLKSFGTACILRYITVRADFSKRDGLQASPYLLLKRGALRTQRKIKGVQMSVQVCKKLFLAFGQKGGSMRHETRSGAVGEVQPNDCAVLFSQCHGAKRGVKRVKFHTVLPSHYSNP